MKIINVLLLVCILVNPGVAQDNEQVANGYVEMNDGKMHTGVVRDKMKSKGQVILVDSQKNKQVFKASDIKSVRIDSITYITKNDEFFRVVRSGPRITLLVKSSEAGGKILYNGSDAIASSTSVGSIGDYFLLKGQELRWITKKNFPEHAVPLFVDCNSINAEGTGQLGFNHLDGLVIKYNNCVFPE